MIGSLLAQSLSDFKLLLIDDSSLDDGSLDDSSLDGSHPICQTFCSVYIAFLDADGRWYCDKFKAQVMVLEQNPKLGVSCCAFIDDNSEPIDLFQGPRLTNS